MRNFFFALLLGFGASLFVFHDAGATTFLKQMRKGWHKFQNADNITIKGNIADKETREAIPFANIIVLSNENVSLQRPQVMSMGILK